MAKLAAPPSPAADPQLEIAELRRAIDAMREQLDLQRLGEAERVQAAINSRDDEIRQLKAMVQAVRDQLDLAQASHREAMDAAERRRQSEVDELHRAITALRDALEEARHD
ncbi:MAG TPA: hypothetical protein VLL76_01555 [Candidatus Omnitrophota bacterium]|nr:hypothetical protein [Candidatus Omnitrophota bacterium]